MEKILLFYITNPSKEHAERLSNELVKGRLVACTNIFPINSFYGWKGELGKGDEYVLVAKTLPGKEMGVRDRVKDLHEDEVPCVISWEVSVNEDYFEWVVKEVSL